MEKKSKSSCLVRGSGGVCSLLLASCANYPERTSSALHDFRSGRFVQALEFYSDPEEVGSEFLSGAEAGTVALVAGDWDQALAHFSRAASAAREIEGRALAGTERLAEGVAGWALNDSVRAYEGEGFERVYVHCALAMAYLAKGRMDDVYVETRLANQLLESEERLYERQYEAGGFGHLISAVTYELIGEPDQAFIDYQRMEEKGVGTSLAGKALVRLAGILGREEELAQYVERYGANEESPAGAANIVVLAGIGLGPHKVESTLTIPTPDGVVQVSVPGYSERPQPVTALRLIERSKQATVLTVPVESVTRIAKENLKDRLAWIAVRSVGRGVLKRELTKALEKEHDLVGRIAGDLFSLFSERADLRAWLTLPDSLQAGRLQVSPGRIRLALEALGGQGVELGEFELEPGETMLVFARTLGTRLFAHAIGGKPQSPLAAPPSSSTRPATP